MIFDMAPAIGIVVAGAFYTRGIFTRRSSIARWRIAAFYVGLVSGTVAIYGPVGALAEVTFSGHMTQHVTLMSLAAPLVVLGDAGRVLRSAVPRRVLSALSAVPQKLRSGIRSPLVVTCAAVVVLWAWHLPALYELALRRPVIHALEHLTFFGTALLVWASVFGRRRASAPVALVVIFVTSLAGAALGAIIVFAGSVLYRTHALSAAGLGIDALVDQQLAGAIMWVPPGVISLVAMIVLTVRIIGSERPVPVGGQR